MSLVPLDSATLNSQVLFAVIISWLLCVILTASGAFEENHPVRTDTKVSILREAPWFRIPFPGWSYSDF